MGVYEQIEAEVVARRSARWAHRLPKPLTLVVLPRSVWDELVLEVARRWGIWGQSLEEPVEIRLYVAGQVEPVTVRCEPLGVEKAVWAAGIVERSAMLQVQVELQKSRGGMGMAEPTDTGTPAETTVEAVARIDVAVAALAARVVALETAPAPAPSTDDDDDDGAGKGKGKKDQPHGKDAPHGKSGEHGKGKTK